MKNRFLIAAAAFFAFSDANAAVTVISPNGSNPDGAPSGMTVITFDDVVAGTTGSFNSGGFGFTGQGGVFSTTVNNSAAVHLQPQLDATNFLAIGSSVANQTATLALASDYTKFGVYWGSIDAGNTITFYNDNVQVFSLSGGAVPHFNPNANAQNAATRNRYVTVEFTGASAFDRVVFSSSNRAFEVDNIALSNAVPELSTWTMMIIAFVSFGFITVRRRYKLRIAL